MWDKIDKMFWYKPKRYVVNFYTNHSMTHRVFSSTLKNVDLIPNAGEIVSFIDEYKTKYKVISREFTYYDDSTVVAMFIEKI